MGRRRTNFKCLQTSPNKTGLDGTITLCYGWSQQKKILKKQSSEGCCVLFFIKADRHLTWGPAEARSVLFPLGIFINDLDGEKACEFKVCEWHRASEELNSFWKTGSEPWVASVTARMARSQEGGIRKQTKRSYRVRNVTQSWNIWLSSKPRNHLELQLVKTFKRSQQYGS